MDGGVGSSHALGYVMSAALSMFALPALREAKKMSPLHKIGEELQPKYVRWFSSSLLLACSLLSISMYIRCNMKKASKALIYMKKASKALMKLVLLVSAAASNIEHDQ